MRGPWFSGSLGKRATIDTLLSCLGESRGGPVVVAGPVWLAEVLAAEMPVVLMIEREERSRAVRALRRARRTGLRLAVAMGRDELPLSRGKVPALVIEGAADLDPNESRAWVEALVPALMPQGKLIALDQTDDPVLEAQVSASFMAGALVGIAQERPREDIVLTIGVAPSAAVRDTRFPP